MLGKDPTPTESNNSQQMNLKVRWHPDNQHSGFYHKTSESSKRILSTKVFRFLLSPAYQLWNPAHKMVQTLIIRKRAFWVEILSWSWVGGKDGGGRKVGHRTLGLAIRQIGVILCHGRRFPWFLPRFSQWPLLTQFVRGPVNGARNEAKTVAPPPTVLLHSLLGQSLLMPSRWRCHWGKNVNDDGDKIREERAWHRDPELLMFSSWIQAEDIKSWQAHW